MMSYEISVIRHNRPHLSNAYQTNCKSFEVKNLEKGQNIIRINFRSKILIKNAKFGAYGISWFNNN